MTAHSGKAQLVIIPASRLPIWHSLDKSLQFLGYNPLPTAFSHATPLFLLA